MSLPTPYNTAPSEPDYCRECHDPLRTEHARVMAADHDGLCPDCWDGQKELAATLTLTADQNAS